MLLKINFLLFLAELQSKHEQEKTELTKRFQAAEEILKVTVLIQKAIKPLWYWGLSKAKCQNMRKNEYRSVYNAVSVVFKD